MGPVTVYYGGVRNTKKIDADCEQQRQQEILLR